MSTLEPSPPGDLTPSQFAARFRECSRVLWCVAAGVLGSREHAEDMLQDAALIALDKLETFEPGTSFVAWMSQTVRFVSLNHRRKLQRRGRALQAHSGALLPTAEAPPTHHREVFDRSVAEALACLTEPQRICLLLKTVVELEYAEIAAALDMPAGTAMSHVSRARARMHRLLEAQSVPGTTKEVAP